jgi:DNA-directed RNA polymerase subunit RPC12/RpoP
MQASARPRPEVAIGFNGLLPGTGLALLRRTLPEVAAAVILAQAGLLAAGSIGIAAYLPVMVAGGLWAWVHVRGHARSPGASDDNVGRPSTTDTAPRDAAAPTTSSPPAVDDDDDPTVGGYAVTVRCTECGAELEVPVLHRAAHCEFCDSRHLVVGQEAVLSLTVPAAVTDERSLREAILDHYRYVRYLELYRRSVAPIERRATQSSPSGMLVHSPEVSAAAAAAEAAVSRAADAYRERLAGQLELRSASSFMAPYRHGMGTLYQAAFGRTRHDQAKRLRFGLATLEASRLASASVELPPMGKLSYLRALRPAAVLSEATRTLPIDDTVDLGSAFGDLDRKNLARDLQVIRLGSRFRSEVEAVVWRPFWIADVAGGGVDGALLVDGASGSVVGPAPHLADEVLHPLPDAVRSSGSGLRFVPMECPTCGHDYPFELDAVLHFCRNCHRVFDVDGTRKTEVAYSRGPSGDAAPDLVPFWMFPLQLVTADGERITDLWHLKDGIDGTLDQIGDGAPHRQHALWVPAIRCINARLMAAAFNRLFQFTARHPLQLHHERFGLDETPRPWPIGLTEEEARDLSPLYLTNAFSARDIARVNVHQVAAWLFEGRQQAPGRLVFLEVPRVLTERFRAYVGRFGAHALDHAAGVSPTAPPGAPGGVS